LRVIRLYRAAFSGLTPAVWLLALVAFVNRCGTMVVPFLSLYLARELGYSKIEAGIVLGSFGAGSVVGSYLGGWLGDRWGAVRVQVVSLLLSGLGFLSLPFFHRLPVIVAAVFAVSVISEAFRPACMACIAESAPEDARTRALALLRLALNLGIGFGLAGGGWLASRRYILVFVADATTCWLAGLVLWAAMSRIRPADERERSMQDRHGVSPWRDPPFLAFLTLVFCLAMVFFQVFSTFPLFLREAYGLREDTIGQLFALNAAMIVVLEMPLVKVLERRESVRLVAVGSLLVAVGFGLIQLGSSASYAALCVAVWTCGEMLALPFSNAIVAHRAGPGSRGRYMGAYGTAISAATVLAPVGGTVVYQKLGSAVLWFSVFALGPVLWLGFEVLGRTMWRRAISRARGAS
jgi:predicted MFS family arabinose efflux permease